MTTSGVIIAILNLVLIVPAIILHEVSHGYVAYLLGDPTAKDAGRLTLNPIAHVDLYGTIILPVIMLLATSGRAAGPTTNIVLAIIGALSFRIVSAFGAPGVVQYVCAFFTLINLVLAFFNLIPIPPLDGSRVVQYFLRGRAAQVYASIERYGILIVLVLVFFGPQIFGVNILGLYLGVTVYPIAEFLGGPQILTVLFTFLG